MRLYTPTVPDEVLISTLQSFGLWETISSHGGLNAMLTDAEPLSHGQRQLFAFARSTLQTGNIVLLDEPNSQSSAETGDMMGRAMGEMFVGKTVVCVAHKLETIRGFDKVIVLDSGEVVEVGEPRGLLVDVGSVFYRLMESQMR